MMGRHLEFELTVPSTEEIRFIPFLTQRPREDGCGVVVLQMLTGKTYGEIAGMITWDDETIHRSTWGTIVGVLGKLGWRFGGPAAVNQWDEVCGVAVVHVLDDHFMLYDADQKVFYDPWEWQGPSSQSARVPLSFMSVERPA